METRVLHSGIIPTAWRLLPTNRYYSLQLDAVAGGLPPRLWAATATAIMCGTTGEIVLSHPVTVFAPRFVEALLNSPHAQHYSASRLTSHKIVLLSPNKTLHRCNTLNPATSLPEKLDEEKHYYIVATNSLLFPRVDLGESPMNNPDLILFTDGSYLRGPHGEYQAGYAVVSPVSILWSFP